MEVELVVEGVEVLETLPWRAAARLAFSFFIFSAWAFLASGVILAQVAGSIHRSELRLLLEPPCVCACCACLLSLLAIFEAALAYFFVAFFESAASKSIESR